MSPIKSSKNIDENGMYHTVLLAFEAASRILSTYQPIDKYPVSRENQFRQKLLKGKKCLVILPIGLTAYQ